MGEEPDVENTVLFTGVEGPNGEAECGDGISITSEDRPRGILSPTDREYLCGLK